MAGHAVEHDYHLIPPSPWPFLSGCAALVLGTWDGYILCWIS